VKKKRIQYVCVAVGLYSSPSKHENAKVTWENVQGEKCSFSLHISHWHVLFSWRYVLGRCQLR